MKLMSKKINQAQAVIDTNKESVKNGASRQTYHFMPEVGWLNDPNGLIYFQEKYHFFYQYNPYDSFWGSMHWGHAVSNDLLHWDYLPVALAPSHEYDNHPQGGCFSGSAIEYNGRLYLFYTSAANKGGGVIQNQSMAYSDDGITFHKSIKNPIITNPPKGYDRANFRDPKVWKRGDFFYMVVSGKKDNLAQALLYKSENLEEWEFFNVLAESRGELGYMWECPDFFPIRSNQGEKYVLTFSPIGVKERTSLYLIGDMNYETGKFNYSTIQSIDWGLDYYAPQSFLDKNGRRIMVAWANEWEWMPWWRDWGPAYQEGWCGSFNLLREIVLDEDGRLRFLPISELKEIRINERKLSNEMITQEELLIPTADGNVFEMILTIDLKQTTTSQFTIKLRCDNELLTVVKFDLKNQMLFINRDKSDNWSNGTSKSPLLLQNKDELIVHLFVDQSSIELFTDDYKTTHSLNVFAKKNQNKNYLSVEKGSLAVTNLVTWSLAKTM